MSQSTLQRYKLFSIPPNFSRIICNYLASLNSIQSPHASHVTWISGIFSIDIKQNHQVCSSYVSPYDSAFLHAEIIHTTRFKGTQVQSDRYIGSLFRVDVPVPEIHSAWKDLNLHSIFLTQACTSSLILASCCVELISYSKRYFACWQSIIHHFLYFAKMSNHVAIACPEQIIDEELKRQMVFQ